MAFAAAAASAALAFVVVTILGSGTAPADLGGPVVVEPRPEATARVPSPQSPPEARATVQPLDPEPPQPRGESDDDEVDDDIDDEVDDDDGGDD